MGSKDRKGSAERSAIGGGSLGRGGARGERDLAAAVMDIVANLVVVLDRQGRIVRFNRACQEASGYTAAETEGRPVWDFLLPLSEVDGVKEAFTALKAGQPPSRYENHWLTKDGRQRLIAWGNTTIVDDADEVAYVVCTGTDITDQRRNEVALRESEERFRATFEQAAVGMAHVALDGHFLRVNQRLCDIVGYSLDEITHLTFQDITYPPDLEVELNYARQLREGEISTYSLEKRYVRKDGSLIWANLTGSLVRRPSGEPDYFIAVVEEIDSRRRAEEDRERLLDDLARQGAFLNTLIDRSPLGIAVVQGDDHRFVLANPAYRAIPGADDTPMVGRTIGEVFPEVAAKGGFDQLDEVYRTGKTVRFREYQAAVGKGREETYWNVDQVPLRGPAGRVESILMLAHDISEEVLSRRRIEELAAKDAANLAQLEAVVNSLTEGMVVADPAGNVLGMNPAALRIHGFQHLEEALRRLSDFPDTFVVEQLDGRPAPVDEWPLGRVLRGETLSALEVRVRRLDTGRTWIASYGGTPVRGDNGEVILAVLAIRDVTTQKEAEAEREELLRQVTKANEQLALATVAAEERAGLAGRRAEERAAHLARLHTVMDLSERVLAEKTVSGLLQRVVDGARQITGAKIGISGYLYCQGSFQVMARSYDSDTPPGPPGEVFAIERGGVYLDLIDKVNSLRLTDEQLRRHPAWWGLPEGHRDLRGLLGARLVGRDGQARGLLMVSDKDQGEFTAEDEALLVQLAALASLGLQHIEARAEVERRAGELDAVFGSMADAVVVYDKDGAVVHANAAVMRLYGADPRTTASAEIARKLRLRYLNGRSVRAEALPSARALRGENVIDQRLVFTDARGRDVTALTSATPLLADGRVTGAVVLWHDVTELTELERLKDQFITVAAHELKTPVTVMKGYAQALVRTSESLSPPHRKMLDAIDRGAGRIDSVVNDLLDISRLQSGRLDLTLERIDLPALVEEIGDRFALTTSKHEIRFVKAEPVVVQGDRDRLEQVIANMLDNAMRYSPKGGPIDVAVDVRDGRAIVSVRDRGVGIPKEKQGRIFQRFYRAHTGTPYDYGGMGVGLYISSEIAGRHGGRMWFESREGRGSTFYLGLPAGGTDG
ncbi:MAG: PAS domain S-box protein [Chloroflexota bacterium]